MYRGGKEEKFDEQLSFIDDVVIGVSYEID